ncbi:MAG: hypothetical protein MJ211_07495 [Bacteroidales bacterium]|nr:hypothetical protein [Bacteroidales bacterium]
MTFDLIKWIRNTKAFFIKLRRIKINNNLLVYLVSLVLATLFWFLNKTGSNIEPTKEFRIEYINIPKDKILKSGTTTTNLKIKLSAKGSKLLSFGGFQDYIRVDLSKLTLQNVPNADSTIMFISDEDIRQQIEVQLPAEFKFISVEPDSIFLDFSQSVTKRVPIILDANISFASQYRASDGINLVPDSAEIIVAASIADSVYQIKTEFIELLNLQDTIVRHLNFSLPEEVDCKLLYTDLKINVEKFTEQSIEIPIQQINVPDSVVMRIFPQTAVVKFYVGWNNYQKINKDMFSIVVDYNELNNHSNVNFLPIILNRFPDKFGVTDIRINPESVEYLIERNLDYMKL